MESKTWDHVVESVRRDDASKWDSFQTAKELSMNDDGKLLLENQEGSKTLTLTDLAFGQMCGKLELPTRYMRRVPANLRARCFNRELQESDKADKRYLVRAKGNQVRAFLSHQYSRISNLELLEIFEQLSKGFQHQIRDCHIDQNGLWLKVLINDLRAWDPSHRSSVLMAGVIIGNSETGVRALSISPFVYRQACTNDAIFHTEQAVSIRHLHLKTWELKARCAEAMNVALKASDQALASFYSAYQDEIENPADVIKRLVEKRGFSNELEDQVQLAFQSEPSPSRFGIANAFTHVAKTLIGDDKVEVERFGGAILMDSQLALAA